jgi:hypothetical protein
LESGKLEIEQRIEMIRRRVEEFSSDIKRTHSIRWRGKNIDLPVIQLKTQDLRYRLENGRTRRKQMQYIIENQDTPEDLFADPESDVAQEAQHEILLGLVDQEGLLDDLDKVKQREPVIITYDGYVLNGNRRLAALRKLKTQHIDCVVLPKDADQGDLYDLEIDLQMRRETKAEYNWVDELLNIRYGLDVIREDDKAIAERMGIDDKEFRKKMSILAYVDLYLVWLGLPDQYFKVEGDQQAFKELEAQISNIKDSRKSESIRELAFALIKDKPEEGSVYTYVKNLVKNYDSIQNKLRDQESFSSNDNDTDTPEEHAESSKSLVDEEIEENTSIDEEDPLSSAGKLDNISNKEKLKPDPIMEAFQSPTTAKKHVKSLVNAINDAKEETKELKDKQAAYNNINTAQRKLASVKIDHTTLKRDTIKVKLKQIMKISTELLGRLNEIEES